MNIVAVVNNGLGGAGIAVGGSPGVDQSSRPAEVIKRAGFLRRRLPTLLAVTAVWPGSADLPALGQAEPYYVFSNFAGLPGTSGAVDGAGSAARFAGPYCLALDADGNLLVADFMSHVIRKVSPAGEVTTFGGRLGTSGYADGPAGEALFSGPEGVAIDPVSGVVYVSDTFNSTIRTITPDGTVSTLAGTAGQNGSVDGTGAEARFFFPAHIAFDGVENLYLAEYFNHTIRRITLAGVVSTLAGSPGVSGSADGAGSAARFNNPNGVVVGPDGNIYVADRGNSTIRRITPGGVVTTLAGLAGATGSSDGTGSAARFSGPNGIGCQDDGALFVAESNHTIRKVTSAGVVTTVGGLAGNGGTADGTGTDARFYSPAHVVVDAGGNLFVADWGNYRISRGAVVYPPPPVPTTGGVLLSGTTDVAYAVTLEATDGVTPYAWSLTGGSLPTGLTLSSSGLISGTPAVAGDSEFTVRVTGANQAYAEVVCSISVCDPLAISTPASLSSGTTGMSYRTSCWRRTGAFPRTPGPSSSGNFRRAWTFRKTAFSRARQRLPVPMISRSGSGMEMVQRWTCRS